MEGPMQAPLPQTHAAQDDNLTLGLDPDTQVNMQQYKEQVPRWKRIHQHSLTQMLFISVQAFCGPALMDAIGGLGRGGLATPKTSNIRFALMNGTEAIFCAFGGVLINILGAKWCLVLGAATFPLFGASYYCNSQFNNQWFLIASGPFNGAGIAFWNIAEGTYVMSIAPQQKRGKYLALWIISQNGGQLVGGAINLAKNAASAGGGGVSPSTYLPFIALQAIALPFALGICEMHNVVRSDGTKILILPKLSHKAETKRILKTFTSKVILCMTMFIIWSYFYNGPWSTYLSLYFSVRSRALSSLISPFFCIVGCFGLGIVTDSKGVSQRRRAQYGFWLVIISNVFVYIWSLIMEVRYTRNDPGAIDWSDKRFAESFLPYFFIQTTGPLAQVHCYWLLSSFAESAQDNARNGSALKCIQAIGNCIAYGVSSTGATPLVGMILNCALMLAAIPGMWWITGHTPDRIPADVIAEEMTAEEAKVAAAADESDKKNITTNVATREVSCRPSPNDNEGSYVI
ncbi:uncharacterized protein L201_008104 [Kwoniella dendrophila CBS 6074]|uniref:MFS general substrate transporter n=1 Tax=Kwoniella dendrophila CBS 6074 TaxID=1295534 RepID=A0AAX4K675_9TREE